MFSGDLVFVDRLLGVLPFSHAGRTLESFATMEQLDPALVVPGHGEVCDLEKARRETHDYLQLLVDHMRSAVDEMVELQVTIDSLDQSAFAHLRHYGLIKGGDAMQRLPCRHK